MESLRWRTIVVSICRISSSVIPFSAPLSRAARSRSCNVAMIRRSVEIRRLSFDFIASFSDSFILSRNINRAPVGKKGDILTERKINSNRKLDCKPLKHNGKFSTEKYLKNLTRPVKLLMFRRNIQHQARENSARRNYRKRVPIIMSYENNGDAVDLNSERTATAVLVLVDGTVFRGFGVGIEGETVGEVCFNTAMTGYQESLTDPSFAGQIITFTFPHIGNVGFNDEDIETQGRAANGLVIRASITDPANWRAAGPLNDWLIARGLIGISGVDTRRLTHYIRKAGAPNGVIAHRKDGKFDIPALQKKAAEWQGLEGMDLAKVVSCTEPYEWTETAWRLNSGYGRQDAPTRHIVAVDYGVKRNILRCLAELGCRITVVPATTTFEEITALKPDGVFLANGPGDPVATGEYAVPVIRSCI